MEAPDKKSKKLFDEHYEILGVVGRGSRSVVYHATLASNPKSNVALKVLLARKVKGKTVSNTELLRKEALAMVSARHRFVIRLDDFHTVNDISYLAMEYAPERDLTQYIAKHGGRLSPEQGQLFFTQAATALDFIHRAGIVHRDIKPSNILVINPHEIRIADFGVATLPGEQSDLSELAAGVGTMDYMAPEVLEGSSYDNRSDLYALCLSFYEMLSGKHPFEGASLADQLAVRRNDQMVNLKKIVPGINPRLASAIMQGLKYSSSDRPADAAALLQLVSVKNSPAAPPPKAAHTEHFRTIEKDHQLLEQPKPEEKKAKATKQPKPDRQESKAASGPASEQQPEEHSDQDKAHTKSRSARRRARKKAAQKRKELEGLQPSSTSAEEIIEENDYQKSASRDYLEEDQQEIEEIRELEPETDSPPPPKHDSSQEHDIEEYEPAAPKSHSHFQSYLDSSAQQPQSQATTSQTEEGHLQQPDFARARVRSNKLIKKAAIVVVTLLILHLFFPGLWKGVGKLFAPDSPYGHQAESPLPHFNSETLNFPKLAAGVYHGSIENIFPNTNLPLALISWPEQNSLAVIVGREGWSPTILNFDAKELADPTKIRVTSNGFVLDLFGQEQGQKVIGQWRNIVSGQQGNWEVQAVK